MNRRTALKTIALGTAALSATVSLVPSPSIELLPHQKYALKLYEEFDKVLVVWSADYEKTFMVDYIHNKNCGSPPSPEGYKIGLTFDIDGKEVISSTSNVELISLYVVDFKKVLVFSSYSPQLQSVFHDFDCVFTCANNIWTVYDYENGITMNGTGKEFIST